jgi:glycosyltransferase involved in cell wall biosynthesis
VPVVGTPVGAVPELIGEGDGRLADGRGLAAAVLDALDGHFDRPAIAHRAARRYGRHAVGAQLADVYAGLLK